MEKKNEEVSAGLHKLLLRQMKKFDITLEDIPDNLRQFLNAVSIAYTHADEDHALIERSLETSSREMGEVNKELQGKIEELHTKTKDLERINKFMIGREIKMADLKREIKELKRKKEEG